MPLPVFISYARAASTPQARALAGLLGPLAFFDTTAIDDGDHFPQRLLDAVLDARLIVLFASQTYNERRFCRLEMRLALTAPDQIVIATQDGAHAVLNALPANLATQSWPAASETDRLATLIRRRLTKTSNSIRTLVAHNEARSIAAVFREESQIPEPQPLPQNCSIPAGIASQSIGNRFVGRANDLRTIHRTLLDGTGGAAQLSSRIAAGGGFGKTRLAVEYLHRYGPPHYPGGLFWLNAASTDLEGEFHRILQTLDPTIPDLPTMRAARRNTKTELERALRAIGRPTLYIADDIPESAPGQPPPPMTDFCPALGAVTVLATSRQMTVESTVKTISVDTPSRIRRLTADPRPPRPLRPFLDRMDPHRRLGRLPPTRPRSPESRARVRFHHSAGPPPARQLERHR